jgi:hypothetical protein
MLDDNDLDNIHIIICLKVWGMNRQDWTTVKMIVPGIIEALAISPCGNYCVGGAAEQLFVWQVSIHSKCSQWGNLSLKKLLNGLLSESCVTKSKYFHEKPTALMTWHQQNE